jgi:hypothetical protein
MLTTGRLPVSDEIAAALAPDQLAQYRGCEPSNYCYSECCEVAREDIEEQRDPDELARARAWATEQTWT